MKNRLGVILIVTVAVSVALWALCVQLKESEPKSWEAAFTYSNLSSEYLHLQHNEKRLRGREEFLSHLQSTLPFLPREKADPLKKFLKEEVDVHVFQIGNHNMILRNYNERVKKFGFDTEDGTLPVKEKPLQILGEFQSVLVPN